jgi:hypothetical protein
MILEDNFILGYTLENQIRRNYLVHQRLAGLELSNR